MTAAESFALLAEATVATTAAIVFILLFRRPLRRAFGAVTAYGTWMLVPSSLCAVLVPARLAAPDQVDAMLVPVPGSASIEAASAATPLHLQQWLVLAWAVGLLAMTLRQAHQQRAFRRALGALHRRSDGAYQAQTVPGLPALVGLWRPVTVVPADFETRYSAEQRALLSAHEAIHLARRDHWANALVATLRAAFWFNPLVHLAAMRFRHDQELACDQRVLALHPASRRAYGEAMFNTQLAAQPLPVGCHWGYGHPLKERIEMLKEPVPGVARCLAGMTGVVVLTLGMGVAAWAGQPARVATNDSRTYLVTRVTEIAGHGSSGELRQYIAEGKSAGSIFGEGEDRWRVTVTPTRGSKDGTVVVHGTVERGKPWDVVMAPTMVVELGKPASIAFNNPDGTLAFRQQLHVVLAGHGGGDVAADPPAIAGADPTAASRHSPPKYPAGALEQRVEGKVVLLVDLDAQGDVVEVVVEASEPAGVFDANAVEAAKGWHFEPEVKDGHPVPSRVRVPVEFKMDPPKIPDAATNGMAWTTPESEATPTLASLTADPHQVRITRQRRRLDET